ncbi:MAG: ankyrin repeat domain-containing protein [Verrucomicrobiales bacterium]|nr:ankyrin repeat domain-containing protein [Verrucomicrobiales bacterium]
MTEDFLPFRERNRLSELCRAGRLFEAQALLEDRQTCRLRQTRKWTPLFYAVDRGFHSLVEVLLRYPHAEWDLKKGYWAALRRRRGDLAALILKAGYDPGDICFASALESGDQDVVQLLLERYPDAGSDFAITKAILRAPYSVANLVPMLSESIPNWEEQVYAGMVSLADRGRLRPVLRYLRLGLDARREGAILDDREKPICEMTTVEAACGSGDMRLIRMLKPSPERDNSGRLFAHGFVTSLDRELIEFLIESGFDINCDAHRGCPVLRDVLCSATYKVLSEIHGHQNQWSMRTIVPNATWLAERGAKWISQDSYDLRCFRDNLILLGREEGKNLLKVLRSYGALSTKDEKRLMGNPRMKRLFGLATSRK